MTRIALSLAAMVLLLFTAVSPVMASDPVVELLRLEVPREQRPLWLAAEARTWQPWLERQDGFLGRDLYWDPLHEEGVLLIRWQSREQWKSITTDAVEQVQRRFDAEVCAALDRSTASPSPFPLVYEGELRLQQLPAELG